MNPFDFVNDILYKKTNLIASSDNAKLAEVGYNPYLTNKALSFHVDSILYANEMNQRHFSDKKLQYDYFLNTIRTMKRSSRWIKDKEDPVIDCISQYYQCSLPKAQEIRKLLTPDQIEIIKRKLQGGVNK